jgi:hypothetical protein
MKCPICHDGEYLEVQRNEIGKLRDEIHVLRCALSGSQKEARDALGKVERYEAALTAIRNVTSAPDAANAIIANSLADTTLKGAYLP